MGMVVLMGAFAGYFPAMDCGTIVEKVLVCAGFKNFCKKLSHA